LIPPVIADTGGLLRALARTPTGWPSFPEYEHILVLRVVRDFVKKYLREA
jgi:hypothetical protein